MNEVYWGYEDVNRILGDVAHDDNVRQIIDQLNRLDSF